MCPMSLWLLALLLVLAAAVAVGLMLVVRRHAPANGFFTNPTTANGVLGVMGGMLAVLTAFVIFVAINNHRNAEDRSVQEAVATSQLYRTTALLPDPLASDLRGDLICYARSVVADEWGAKSGEPSDRVQEWLDAMSSSLATSNPATEREKVGYSEFFSQDAERRDGRRGRLYAGQSVVPTFLWIVLLIGAVAVSALALLLTTPRDPKFVHAVMAAGLAVMLVAGLSTIQYLSDPFAGTGAIKPREMQRTIALWRARSPRPSICLHCAVTPPEHVQQADLT
jgi:hypothetical protein